MPYFSNLHGLAADNVNNYEGCSSQLNYHLCQRWRDTRHYFVVSKGAGLTYRAYVIIWCKRGKTAAGTCVACPKSHRSGGRLVVKWHDEADDIAAQRKPEAL